jgi:hypothetical protein
MPFDGAQVSQVTRDLIAARELLLSEGWVPECGSEHGPHCASTAIRQVVGWHSRRNSRNRGRFDDAIGVLRAELGGSIAWWNDHQLSIDPVLELFDRAIKRSL